MPPFGIKREDGRAQWRVLFDHFHSLPFGTLVRYEDLLRMLDTSDIRKVHQAALKAREHLWDVQRSIVAEPGRGYRVLTPIEHKTQSAGFQRAGRKKIKDSVKVLNATDINGMSNSEVAAHIELSRHANLLAQQMDAGELQRRRIDRLFKTK